ncbi:hypothetical protein [Aureitalea sp. L0-47]|nr:hypothetical protein [Aureitalea sp. L0-47]
MIVKFEFDLNRIEGKDQVDQEILIQHIFEIFEECLDDLDVDGIM